MMENRITQYFAEHDEIAVERRKSARDRLVRAIRENEENFIGNFNHALEEVCVSGLRLQEAGAKGAIAYLCIAPLRSSLEIGTCTLSVDLYDENVYLDEIECASCWDIPEILSCIKADQQFFLQCARKKMVRILEAEMMIYMQQYREVYFAILGDICAEYQYLIEACEAWKSLKKRYPFQVTFGEYRDRGFILRTIETEGGI